MKKLERFATSPGDPRNNNILPQYPLEHAEWIRHPDACGKEISVSEFHLEIDLKMPLSCSLHLSADNRYEWFLDGEFAGMGPDRSDPAHWAFASYRVNLEPGKHNIKVMCFYLGKASPLAQYMLKPGFIFGASEKSARPLFNTGTAPWKVREYAGLSTGKGGWATGGAFLLDCTAWNRPGPFIVPVTTESAIADTGYGIVQGAWKLHPSNLPEQMREPWKGTEKVRAVLDAPFESFVSIGTEDPESPDAGLWQDFLNRKAERIDIPPESEIGILIDFEDYLCAYPVLGVSRGRGAEVSLSWYESAYGTNGEKGDRSTIAGKIFPETPQWDLFRNFDGTDGRFSIPWWRAGRYVLLKIRTRKEPLSITELFFMESRSPLEPESNLDLNDPELDELKPMMLRALQCCTHETYMDCPHYEQMMYVGDTRLEMLVTYVLTRDSALPERAVDLFDWSRSNRSGLVAERCPSRTEQLSGTFSMIWPLMLRDFMMYRRIPDARFRNLRFSVRSLIQTLEEYINHEGLIEHLPGWSFVDWLDTWEKGVPGDGGKNGGLCSVFSLHYLAALAAARELEQFSPETGGYFDVYLEQAFERTREAVVKKFWCPEKGLFADNPGRTLFSVHAQSLALLAGVLSPENAEKCLYAIRDSKTIARPTVSFIFYYFDALKKYGRGDWIFNHLSSWKTMKKMHAVTTWEKEDPSRSDCHAWGAHLLYHYYTSIAGIRPGSPGFRTVRITPSLGPLKHISGKMVHPEGFIEFDFMKDQSGRLSGRILLPGTCSGKFAFGGHGKLLSPGENIL